MKDLRSEIQFMIFTFSAKENRFVGIVIDRGGTGLRAWMLIRNYLKDVGGVECMVDLYSPSVKEIEVLKLEKRLDDELYYLRDCDPKYCMVPIDMVAEKAPENKPIPINDVIQFLLFIYFSTKYTQKISFFNDEKKTFSFFFSSLFSLGQNLGTKNGTDIQILCQVT